MLQYDHQDDYYERNRILVLEFDFSNGEISEKKETPVEDFDNLRNNLLIT